ncbi:metallophosphoesterase [Actinophytocola xanthii]|uniref:Metallophosphoesterase n=1 Tax=Actinophytocola xanthii TaxID=1912961 RepID=A0A1Q8CUM1_9PSEU|nr:metallophosphoesterase [Actinophytocola xanthii]OLF18014.1 metallophosphoesterase [Actinophytocola xanthii]
MIIGHVSDLHFGHDLDGDGGARATRRAHQVLDYLERLPGEVDVLLVTGDIADHGLPAEYFEAARLLGASRFPVLTCPGNHDERSAYRAVFPDGRADGPVNQVHRVAGATFAMCDSSIPGRADGLLDEETIGWLDEVLSAVPREEPAFVCFHHPPVRLEVPFVDDIRQFGEERLAELLGRHQQVVAVLCGHAHTAAATTFAGRPLLVAPGVVSTIVPPLESDTIVDYRLPPGFAFHVLTDDRRLVTHFRSL